MDFMKFMGMFDDVQSYCVMIGSTMLDQYGGRSGGGAAAAVIASQSVASSCLRQRRSLLMDKYLYCRNFDFSSSI
jgi:hypothetical protein